MFPPNLTVLISIKQEEILQTLESRMYTSLVVDISSNK